MRVVERKNRTVSAPRHGNAQGIVLAAFQIIGLEVTAQLAGFDPHDRSRRGIETARTTEDQRADLMTPRRLAPQRALDDVLEETPIALGGDKVAARQDALQLPVHFVGFGCRVWLGHITAMHRDGKTNGFRCRVEHRGMEAHQSATRYA